MFNPNFNSKMHKITSMYELRYTHFKGRLSSHNEQGNGITTLGCWTPLLNKILDLDAVKNKGWGNKNE